jgi:alkanesulfonate monooxygenase SsuD/methylene tetrahydromethanopterin reductase-like flavin-dependent oxidoreductase (luciferase family)
VAGAAREAGAGVAAIATAPVAGAGLISPGPRYQRMAERFGPTAQEVLTCACHVHVSVESDEEGIAAIDRIRVWLPQRRSEAYPSLKRLETAKCLSSSHPMRPSHFVITLPFHP